MTKEPRSNIGLYCEKHAPKPIGFSGDPQTLVGCYVKKGFPVESANVEKEHMWVKVISVKDGVLIGTLANDPLYLIEMRCGDKVEVKLDEIEAKIEAVLD